MNVVHGKRKEILYGNGLVGEVSRNNSTPECEVNGTENALTVECVIYLFIYC